MLEVHSKVFTNIVNLYGLWKPIEYYKLYNTSKYINSYHGWAHVQNFIWALYWYSVKNPNVSRKLIGYLMIAAIFHDFNYVGIEKGNPNYDEANIEAALNAWDLYTDYDSKITIDESSFVASLIKMTQYPLAGEIIIDDFLKNFLHLYDVSSEFVSNLILDCDHSMPMFKNYNFLCWQFLTYEMQSRGYEGYVKSCGTYLMDLKYNLGPFQKRWDIYQENVIADVKLFLKKVKDGARFEIDYADVYLMDPAYSKYERIPSPYSLIRGY